MLSDWVLTAPSLLPLTQGFDSFEILSILTKGKLYLNGVLQGRLLDYQGFTYSKYLHLQRVLFFSVIDATF